MIMDLDKKAEPFAAPREKNLHITSDRFDELGVSYIHRVLHAKLSHYFFSEYVVQSFQLVSSAAHIHDYNEFTKRFNETDLLKKMYEANYSKDIYITVLDEMNIARVEYYFAEFLSLLERHARYKPPYIRYVVV